MLRGNPERRTDFSRERRVRRTPLPTHPSLGYEYYFFFFFFDFFFFFLGTDIYTPLLSLC